MQPEDIDKLFRDSLADHAPTPPAYLWNQLEEELQPVKKRPVLWMWAAAASVVLLLVSGVVWLQTGFVSRTGTGTLATVSRPSKSTQPSIAQPENKSAAATTQATPPQPLVSSPSEAAAEIAKAPLKQSPGAHPQTQQLATAAVPNRRSRRVAPATRPEAQKNVSAPEAVAALAPKTQPERPSSALQPLPEPRQLPTMALAGAPAAPIGPIEVEVRRGNESTAMATADSQESSSRPKLGGLLLRQARNAVRGDRVSLTEAGLPETVTVQARVAGRTLTKVIQL